MDAMSTITPPLLDTRILTERVAADVADQMFAWHERLSDSPRASSENIRESGIVSVAALGGRDNVLGILARAGVSEAEFCKSSYVTIRPPMGTAPKITDDLLISIGNMAAYDPNRRPGPIQRPHGYQDTITPRRRVWEGTGDEPELSSPRR